MSDRVADVDNHLPISILEKRKPSILKGYEDVIDAIICALVGYHFLVGSVTPFGNANEGIIWNPKKISSDAPTKIQENNPQYGNVGNLGDILKHAALIALTEIAIGRTENKLAYIDTHAFRLSATCPFPDEWHKVISDEIDAYSGYRTYYDAERQIMQNKPYRCSSGLVLDLINTSHISYCAFLGEKDPETRDRLKHQLHAENQERCKVLSDGLAIANLKLPADVDILLMLVDPFVLDDKIWNAINMALCNYANSGIEIITQVFTYDIKQDIMQWPETAQLGYPCAFISRRPFHLAVYATNALTKDVVKHCEACGWLRQK